MQHQAIWSSFDVWNGKRGANTFIKQHISCHSVDGLSSLVKTIPVQTSQSSKVNETSRDGWDLQLGCSQVLSVLSYYFLFCTHTIFFFFSSLCIFPWLCVGCSSPWPIHIPVALAAGRLTVGHSWPCLQTPCLCGWGYRLFYRTCGRLRMSQLRSREYESNPYQELHSWTSGQRHSWIKWFVYLRTKCVGYIYKVMNGISFCEVLLWNKPIRLNFLAYIAVLATDIGCNRHKADLQTPRCTFRCLIKA